MKHIKISKGFTLIELLVVVAIISLLTSIVLASLNTARIKARDTKRITEIKQLKNALELYYADNNVYPVSVSSQVAKDVLGNLTPKYIKNIPEDPLPSSGRNYYYKTFSSGTSYNLLVDPEQTSGSCITGFGTGLYTAVKCNF